MSSNRIRDQFSSVGFNIADPLALTAADIATNQKSAASVQADQALSLGDHARIDVAASNGAVALAAHNTVESLAHAHSDAALHSVLRAASAQSASLDSFSAAPKFAAANLSGLNPAAAPDLVHAQNGLPSILSAQQVAASYDGAQHAGLAGAQGYHETAGAAPGHAPGGAPPPAGAVAGQLWSAFGGPGVGNSDGHSDFRVEHADSDGLSNDWVLEQSQASTGEYVAIGLDTSAGLSIALDGSTSGFHLHITNLATGVDLTSTVVASAADFDVMNGFAVDANSNTIYADLFGYDYLVDGGDILKITYNQTNGTISNPYSFNDTNHTFSMNYNNVLLDSVSSGNKYADGRAFFLSHDGSTLYYVDDNDNDPGAYWGFSTNGVYKVSTSGDVGHGTAPTPTLLSSQAQFPTNDSAGYITGIAVSEAKGIIYFTTDGPSEGVSTAQDGIWWMPITGGTATKMTIPGGVSVSFPTFFGNALAIDIKSQQLYYSDKQTGQIVQFTLSADGHSFASATNFAAFDSNGGTAHDGAFSNAMAFDDLPTLSPLTATSTEAVQGGSAITLLTATPSISDVDNINLRGATVTVTNAQTGDILLLSGSQSGSSSGVSWSYNTSTHVMTLSGEASLSTYQSLLALMSYQDTGTDNSVGSHPTRTINFTISDGVTIGHPSTADSNEQTITVVIDRPPTLTSDSYSVVESATASGTSGTGGTGVLGNDNDKDGDAIVVTAVNGVAGNVGNSVAGTYGHLTLNSNGSFSYVADFTSNIDNAATGSHPVDSFTYTVSDGLGGVTTSTVSFTIDRPPTVVVDAGAAVEGSSGSGNVLTNDSDKDGDSLTVSQVNGAAGNVGNAVSGTYGQITINSNGSYTYQANNTAAIDAAATGSHLTDTFTYQASDGHGGTTTTTITVTLDRPPTVVADAGAAVESFSGTGNVLTNDSDRDADTLTVSAVAGLAGNVGHSVAGTYGHLTLNSDGSYTYLADNTAAIDAAATGSHLTDTFTYTDSDGHGGSSTTNLVITLDRAPTVVNDSNSALEGSGASANAGSGVLANDSDRDGDSLVVSAVAGAAGNVGNSIATTYGHLTVNSDGSYSYTADNTSAIDAAANGSHPVDTVTITVSDGQGGTTNETLSFTIDRAPTVAVDAGAAVEGSSGSGNVLTNDSDKDGDSLTVSSVNGAAGNVGNSVAGTYGEITINSDGSYTYLADNTAAIDAAATGSHLTDTFSYTASDGHGGTTTTTITVTLDRAPTVVADAGAAVESFSGTGNVLTNDSDRDGDTLVVSAVAGLAGNVGNSVAGTYGHLTLNSDGSYTYLADNTAAIDGAATGSHLTDTFTYTASDGQGGTTTTNLVITIDRAPTVVNDSGNALEGAGASANAGSGVLANDSDRDGDSLVVSAVAGAAGNVGNSTATTYGHITLNADGSYSYTADNTSAIDAAANGSHPVDVVTFTVSDGQGGTTDETISFTIDRAPTVVNDGANDAEGGTATATALTGVLANDSDKDGDSLTVSAVAGAAGNVGTSTATTYGHITLNADGSYSYIADNTAAIDAAATGSHPIDSITVTVSDGHGGTTDETLAITIDRPAVATADGLSTFENQQAINGSGGNPNLLANDSDPDGDTFAITAVNGATANVGTQITLASGALLTVNSDGTYTYDPNHAFDYLPAAASGANSQATDTFTYTISGGSTVTVTVTINGVDSNDILQGTINNDNFNGGIGDDTFKMQDGGNDTVVGGSGNDVFFFGGSFTAADQIDGGTGTDRLSLNGDYTGGNAVTFGATTMVNVEGVTLVGGHSYNLTTADATVGSGRTLTVSASGLGAGDTVTFNGAAETDGSFAFQGGLGTNVLTGGAQADTFVLQVGSSNTLAGGGGNDTFNFGAAFVAGDQVDGGTGSDTLQLNGDYSAGVTFNSTTLVNVETINFSAGHSYNLTTADATVASGQTLTVNGSSLGATDSLVFNGGAETNGTFVMIDGAGNDTLTGGSGNDSFTMKQGGNDTVSGGGGDDTFNFAGAFNASDKIDGGTGNDKLVLSGDYSAGVVFNATTMVNVETINLAAGHSYNLTTADATVASGQTLTVNGSALGAGDVLTFIGSAETDGNFLIYGGAGNDVLGGGAGNDTVYGGGGNDTFKMQNGGTDNVSGGDGDDVFFFDGHFTAADTVVGGAGNDRLSLNGDYTGANAVVFNPTTMVGVETIALVAGHSYDLTPANATASSVTTLTVLGSGLGAGDSLTFNASGVTTGSFVIYGGAGNDTLSGGSGNDIITGGNGINVMKGGGGQDVLIGGTGADTFVYGAVSESTSTTHDIVRGFDATQDFFDLNFGVTGVDATVASGHLGGANFDGNLASAIGAGQLAAYHAVLFTPDSGSYAGHTILVVDANGVAGYQAGQDLVLDLQNPTNVSLTTGNFI